MDHDLSRKRHTSISKPQGQEESAEQNQLLTYLPEIYQHVEFVQSFVQIFCDILTPLEQQLNHLYVYFEPHLTPAEFLPWLSTWLAATLDENLPVRQQRKQLSKAPEIYAWRGTARALHLHLSIALNVNQDQIKIEDHRKADSSDELKLHRFCVKITMSAALSNDEAKQRLIRDRVIRIIQEEKPAHTVCELTIEWPYNEHRREFITL